MLAYAIIVVVSLCTAYAAVAKHPMDVAHTNSEKDTGDIPESCKGLTYCTVKPKNYPEEKFNSMFKGYKALPQPSLDIELNNRQGDPSEMDNCESEVIFEPLYKVKDKTEGMWRTVVQAPGSLFIQQVRLERCTNEGGTCFKDFRNSKGVTPSCMQKYNTWQVLVLKKNNETETISTELPVCCSCHYDPSKLFRK